MEKFNLQYSQKILTIIALYTILFCGNALGQKTQFKNLNTYIEFETSIKKDTLSFQDSVTIIISVKNISDSVFIFYPNSMYMIQSIEKVNAFYDVPMIVVNPISFSDKELKRDRKKEQGVYKKTVDLYPGDLYEDKIDVGVDEKLFKRGLNCFNIIYTYPTYPKIFKGGIRAKQNCIYIK